MVSPDSATSKSYLAANLAVASQLSGRTLLIDADMRIPRQHDIFGLADKSTGLSSILPGAPAPTSSITSKSCPACMSCLLGIVPPIRWSWSNAQPSGC